VSFGQALPIAIDVNKCMYVCVSEEERRKGDLPTWKSRETAAGVGGMRRGRRLMQLLEESFAPSMEQWVLWCDYVEEQRRAWTGFAGLWGGWR
jgi:hypothetical protein